MGTAQTQHDIRAPYGVDTVAQRIGARHPARERFAAMSTGTATKTGRIGYYETKGRAVNAFDMALAAYDLCFAAEDCDDFAGDDGWKTLAVCNGGNIRVGYARLSWHRMESGRYEFTGYIS